VFSNSYSQEAHHGGLVAKRIELLTAKGTRFVPVDLFKVVPSSSSTDALWKDACKAATLLQLDATKCTELIAEVDAFIRLTLPSPTGNVVLELERIDITTDDFSLIAASTGRRVELAKAAHYRGMIAGDPNSVVALSVFEEQVMGIISNGSGERVLGPLENDRTGFHILYHEDDLLGINNTMCGTTEATHSVVSDHGTDPVPDASRTTKCVRYYWEVGYDIYQNKGSLAATTSFITGLFNQSATLFANDGIDVTLSEVFVWDVASPYGQTTSNGRLNQFGVTRTSFNGDMAHLIDLGSYGGVAWLNTLCNAQTRYRMAYSGIYSSYSNVPTYSWSVEVVTHEQGHSLGSQHTHACSWNGNNTAIDGCGPTYGSQYSEGSCPIGPVPTSAVGGTIMSYCHLVSAGIKFVNGFGPQPTGRIVTAVNGASCLTVCGNSCDAPGSLFAAGVSATAATLTWAAIGATTYTLQWKPTSSGTWTTVTGIAGNTYPLTGLTATTSYDFRVLSVCGGTNSGYSATYTFISATPCPDNLEPNNSITTAGAIVLPRELNALIATAVDVDYYSFTTTVTSDIYITLSGLAGDYDLYLRNSSGTQLAYSQASGTSSESINYPNAAPGNYIIHVFGYNGAFSADQCYLLYANAVAQSCPVPSDLNADSITYNGALLEWGSNGVLGEFSLQYRVAPQGNWTTVAPVTQTSYSVTGLLPSTAYNFRVAKICAGGQLTYSGIGNFVTLALPCELAPTVVVAAKVFLDGPYNSSTQLMNDGLRTNGLIPTTQPYSQLGYTVLGALTTTSAVLAVSGNNAIVDWVLVELRGTSSPYAVVETRAGLLQRDGDIVAVNGTSALGFCVNPGNYRIAIRHRNHLACMSGSSFALSSTATSIDLTTSTTITYGTNARKISGNKMLLWAGNTEPDQELLYTGQNNDRDLILLTIGGITPTNSVTGYLLADVNLDGTVLYTGQNNDRDIILTNIGGVVPTATVLEQMP